MPDCLPAGESKRRNGYTGRAATAAGFSTGRPGVRVARSGQPNPRSVRDSAYDALLKTSPKIQTKRNTMDALRGVIHVACFHPMFGLGRLAMPSVRRGDVKHATLLFCAGECRFDRAEKRFDDCRHCR